MLTKVAACEIALGGEVVKLHPVVVAQSPHEAARRCGEAMLVVPDEADDVAERWVRLPVHRQWNDPRWGRPVYIWRQLIAIYKFMQGICRHRRPRPRQGIQHHDWLRWSHCEWVLK
jgi:hypothetical protein